MKEKIRVMIDYHAIPEVTQMAIIQGNTAIVFEIGRCKKLIQLLEKSLP